MGFVVLGWRALRGNRAAAAVFFVVMPIAVLYVARPSIRSDQPWAMRRYLPVVIPGIAIAIVVVLVGRVDGGDPRPRGSGRTSPRSWAWRCARSLVAVPTAMPRPRRSCTLATQHGADAAMHARLRRGRRRRRGARVRRRYLDIELPQTMRGFCGVPAAEPVELPDPISRSSRARLEGARAGGCFVVTGQPDEVADARRDRDVVGHDVDPRRRRAASGSVRPRGRRRFEPDSARDLVLEIPPSAA